MTNEQRIARDWADQIRNFFRYMNGCGWGARFPLSIVGRTFVPVGMPGPQLVDLEPAND